MFGEVFKFSDIFLFLFIPGFLMYKMILLILPVKSIEISKSAIEIMTYGVINFVVYLIIKGRFEIEMNTFWTVSFFAIIPIIISITIGKLMKTKLVRTIYDVSPTPWDSFFMSEERMLAIVFFKDGSVVGGYFGDKSDASKYPRPKEIFLEKEWIVDKENEKLTYEITDSNGIWINCSEVKSIKFF